MRALTLLEVMVVMALIAMVSGVVGLFGHRALAGQRFEASVDAVVSKLSLAQEITLCTNADVTVHLKTEGGHYVLYFESAGTTLVNYDKLMNEVTSLPDVTRILWDGENEAAILFSAERRDTWVRGNLRLEGAGDQEATIGVPGYPKRIVAQPIPRETYAPPPYPNLA